MGDKEKLMNAIKEYDLEWNHGAIAEMLEDFFDFNLKDLILFGFSDEALRWCYSTERIEKEKKNCWNLLLRTG